MARRVKRIEDEVEYILDIGENRTEENPFTVTGTPLSGEEYMKIERSMGKITRGQDVNFMTRAQLTRERIITDRISKVSNYEVEDQQGNVFTPTNGKELIKAVKIAGGSEPDLVLDEIVDVLKDHSKLAEGLVKKLDSQSKSNSSGTKTYPAGVAKGAAEKSVRA